MRRHNLQKARPCGQAAARSALPWRFFVLTIICACILATGFFFAARQHFMTMDLGLKNSKMRNQIEELEFERRRLILAKEISISPIEITRTAQSMGFRKHLEPPSQPAINIVKRSTDSESPKLVLTTYKQQVKTGSSETGKGKANLVMPTLQQTAVKQTQVNERPRIVGDATNPVAAVGVKAAPKLR